MKKNIKMPIIHVPKEIKDIAYFCPHCKHIFKKPMKANEGVIVENYSYKCIATDCGKYFNQDTYREKNGNGKKYHYIKHSKLTVQEIITKHIISLLLEGESQKTIHDITHFSREIIDKIIKSYFNQSETFTFSTFKSNYLKGTGHKYSSIENAIQKGCSHRLTSKLYKVSPSTILRALERNPVTIDYSVKISFKDNIITLKSHKEENFFS